MDMDEIRCKFQRGNNGDVRLESESEKMDEQYQDEEEEGENERGGAAVTAIGGGEMDISTVGRFYGWPSSRIVRVSRATGGKDRHSKVLTSKGLRDRRVRLSVNTAIQFYDLQDRLGFDQPSKAVEWLLKAAASSISELPPISNPFQETPNQLSDEKRSSTGGSDQIGFDSTEVEMDGGAGGGEASFSTQFATKSSACSSPCDTSKGSVLSLSRSESRIKARERAKERVAEKEKEKEKEKENESLKSSMNNPISQITSFTELLNRGINNDGSVIENQNAGAGDDGSADESSSFFLKSSKQWPSSQMDYFGSGLLTPSSSRLGPNHFTPMFGLSAADNQSELLQFSFVPDHLVQVVNNNDNGSSLAGFNRGTLQSNSPSPSMLPHIQRFSDGSPASFFTTVDNDHQFLAEYDAHSAASSSHGSNKDRGK